MMNWHRQKSPNHRCCPQVPSRTELQAQVFDDGGLGTDMANTLDSGQWW